MSYEIGDKVMLNPNCDAFLVKLLMREGIHPDSVYTVAKGNHLLFRIKENDRLYTEDCFVPVTIEYAKAPAPEIDYLAVTRSFFHATN